MHWKSKRQSRPRRHGGPLKACRLFLRNRDGATAVEFALVSIPFFGLLFAVFQTAMVFWSTQVLETAVANASRQIYTQQFKSANSSLDPANATDLATLQKNFKTLLCSNVSGLFDCNAAVDIDVRVLDSFSSSTVSPPVLNGAYNPSQYTFQMPGPNQIVLVRASMQYPAFATIGNSATALSNGNWLIMASAAFRTEP